MIKIQKLKRGKFRGNLCNFYLIDLKFNFLIITALSIGMIARQIIFTQDNKYNHAGRIC